MNAAASRFGSFGLAFTFARRDLRAGLGGFYIFLACLILGVGAIAGVQSLSLGLVESLQHDGRYILGGDLALRTLYAPPKPAEQAALAQLGKVSSIAQVRAMALQTLNPAAPKGVSPKAAMPKTTIPNATMPKATMIELKAIDGAYPLYGALEAVDESGKDIPAGLAALLSAQPPPAAKTKAPALPGAVAEKEVLSRLDAHIGDVINIGGASFVLRGVIRKEPDRLGVEGFSLAPRVMIAQAAFPATGLGAKGNQVYYDQRVAVTGEKTPAALKTAQGALQKSFPKAGWRVRDSFNAAPRLEELIGRLSFFLTLISLATLLVGGVGISNAVRGYLDARMSHIATLKCLGAPARLVFGSIMLQIGVLTLGGVAAGLLLGAGAAPIAGSFLTARLTVTDHVGFYPRALLIAALFGFLTALCFSLWPVGRAVRVAPAELFRDRVLPGGGKPVRAVILGTAVAAELLVLLAVGTASDQHFALWFAAGAAAVFGIFTGYAALLRAALRRLKLPGLPLLRMAAANLHRPGNTASSVILSLGLGLTVLSAVALIEFNFQRLITDDLSTDAPSFFFIDILPTDKAAFMQLLQIYPGMRDLRLAPSMRGRITAVNGVAAERALADKSHDWVIRSDRGFTYTGKLPPYSRIVEGNWWAEDYKGPPLVSIATDVAKAFQIGPGDKLTVNVLGVDITATVANVREIDWASFTMNFAVTFAPGALEDVPATYLGTVILPPEQEEAAESRIAARFPGVTVLRVKEALETAGTVVRAVAEAIRIAAAVTLLAGGLVLAGGIAAARRRHVYDAVILKVLGAPRRRILATFLLEYGAMGALTVLIAAALGTLAAWAMLHFILDLHWKFSPVPLVSVAALCLGLTLSAGFAGTWRALRQRPAAFLRTQ